MRVITRAARATGAGAPRRRWRWPTTIVAADGAPPAERLDAELIAAEALLLGAGRPGRGARIAAVEGRIDPRTTPGAWGEFLRVRGAAARAPRAGPTRRTTTSRRASACSNWSASATRRRSATSRWAGWRAKPARARSPIATSTEAPRRLPRARLAPRSRRDRTGAGRAPVPRAPASTSARPPTPTTPWCSAWSTRRCCPTCSRTSWPWPCARRCSPMSPWCSSTPAGGDVAPRSPSPGGDAGTARARRRPRPRWAPAPTARCRSWCARSGADPDGPRSWWWPRRGRGATSACGALRMMAAVAHQGFDLCAARERPAVARAAIGRASARAAARRVHLRVAVDAAGRRAGAAPAGQRPHRAHHRRERHRQGTVARAIHVGLAAQRRDLPALQLHDDHARARRQPAVRPSPRRLHRRGQRPARASSARPPAARCSSTRSAICPSTSSPSCCASWSRARSCRSATPAPAGRRAGARGHQRRPRAARQRRQVPRGSLLPAERDPHPHPAAAPAARRDPAPGHVLPARGVPTGWASPTCS